jgi:hypothetical protein
MSKTKTKTDIERRIANERWFKKDDNVFDLKKSNEQQSYGKNNWQENGIRRYMHVKKAIVTRKANAKNIPILAADYIDNDLRITIILAADYIDNDLRITIKERQRLIPKKHIPQILETIDKDKQGLSSLDVAEKYPALFWNIYHHYNCVDSALQELGHGTKRRKRERKTTEKFVYTTSHFNDDNGSYEVEELSSSSEEEEDYENEDDEEFEI